MKFLPMIAVPLLLLGCTAEEKGKLSPLASIFTPSDLAAGTVNVISPEDIADAVAFESDLWANASAAALTESASCLDEKLASLPIRADKANVSLVAEFDAAACFNSDDLGLAVNSAPFRFAMWLGCQNKNLEELDGKTFGELGDNADLKCASEGEQQMLTNMEFKILASGEVETNSGAMAAVDYGFRSITATQSVEGGPCKLTSVGDAWLWQSDCVTVSKKVVTQMDIGGESASDALTADYLRLSYVDLVESNDTNAPWYQSGGFQITLNNWQGTITYNGTQTAPSWTLNNGTVTESGTLALAPLKAVMLLPGVRSAVRPRAQDLRD